MERKTKVIAEEGRQELRIVREFALPVALLFRAFTEAGIVAQWMGTQVLKLECRPHGSYLFETTDPRGNKHRFNGTIHEFLPDQKITRTFEMEGTPFPVQLEFLEFEALGEDKSRLRMHVVFQSVAVRDQLLQLPFAAGIDMAHTRLQEVVLSMKGV